DRMRPALTASPASSPQGKSRWSDLRRPPHASLPACFALGPNCAIARGGNLRLFREFFPVGAQVRYHLPRKRFHLNPLHSGESMNQRLAAIAGSVAGSIVLALAGTAAAQLPP